MGMFRRIRAALASLNELPTVIEGVQIVLQEGFKRLEDSEQTRQRLDDLEVAMRSIMGEAEALATRAESQLKAARGAEERARGMQRRAEKLQELVGSDEESEELIEYFRQAIQSAYAGRGPENGVPALPGGVEPVSGKEAARARKFGNAPEVTSG